MSAATRTDFAIVTGGTGGIGMEVSRLLARKRMNVAFSYRANTEAARSLEQELLECGVTAKGMRVDLAQPESVENWIEEVCAEFGSPKVAVHAAGPFVPMCYISRIPIELFKVHVEAELFGFYNLCSFVVPRLRLTKGSIVAVTSIAAHMHVAKDILSASPKAAIEALVRGIAREEGKFGVRANAVAPGIIAGGAMASTLIERGEFDAASQEYALQRTALGRFGLPREVAELVAFLSSDKASFISGQTIAVDGGYLC